ncbi:MAG: hypothetical protein HRT73_10360 [Flavobacteriales bacterium]|nr:hypothetical protein [Flavobacteriales bacterium]
MKSTYLIIILSLFAFSCSKKLDCDNARLCFENIGNDTINYCWGCYPYTEVLLPGGKICRDVGEIDDSDGEDLSVYYFDSDHGNYPVRMNSCYVLKQIK